MCRSGEPKKLKKVWKPATFVKALKSTNSKAWSSSCSVNDVVLQNTYVMEHHPDFKTQHNPIGVGPYFGKTSEDGNSDTLAVDWCDKKNLDIKQTLCWVCPPVDAEKPLRVKHPDTGKVVTIYVLSYTKRGVSLLVQDAPAKRAAVQHLSPVKKKKRTTHWRQRKGLSPERLPRRRTRLRRKLEDATKGEEDEEDATKDEEDEEDATKDEEDAAKDEEDEEDATEDEEDATKDEEHTDSLWKRCRRKLLTKEQRTRLTKAVDENMEAEDMFTLQQWQCFVDRVAREYVFLHRKQGKKDDMHLNRENVLKSAVAAVADSLYPKSLRPNKGCMPELLESVQPLIEVGLALVGPSLQPRRGSLPWIAEKKKSCDITYKEASEFPELMDVLVSKLIAEQIERGSPNGLLVLTAGEHPVGPDVPYVLSSTRVGRRRATASAVWCCVV